MIAWRTTETRKDSLTKKRDEQFVQNLKSFQVPEVFSAILWSDRALPATAESRAGAFSGLQDYRA